MKCLSPFGVSVRTNHKAEQYKASRHLTHLKVGRTPRAFAQRGACWSGAPLRRFTCGLCALALHITVATAQDLPAGAVWIYHLTEGSQMIDDCPICDRLPIVEPIRGSFELRLLQASPLYSDYAIDNLWFTNTGPTGRTYQIAGRGTLQVGGEVALRQSLFLELQINNGVTNDLVLLDTNSTGVTRSWPMLQVGVDQTNGTAVQQYHLDLNAAPLREIWFSTAQDFSATIWGPPTNLVRKGDLLSTQGRRVRTNAQLAGLLGVMPPVPDLGLKDFDLLPGGEIVFSIEAEVWSETLGRTLHTGDLLSDRGLLLRANQGLIAAFVPGPETAGDVGLAAVQTISSGQTWFSVETNFVSKSLNTTITTGDLLSDAGWIVRSNGQLLNKFQPTEPATNAGLKAVYVWPSGEIWFCTATGFSGENLAKYEAGDLLSDQGYIVYRNSELLAAFAPSETNAPLDGLWLVTDAVPNSAEPLLKAPRPTNQPPASVVLAWSGQGRVFQLEMATNVAGAFSPLGPITPDMQAIDAFTLSNAPAKFYRVRQW